MRASSHAAQNLRSERGQTVVEFVLILPVLLIVIFLIAEFARGFNAMNDLNQMAADGARFAAVNRIPSGTSLPDYIKGQGDTNGVVNKAKVCVSYPNGSQAVGQPVKVEASFDFDWLPALGNLLPGSTATLPIKGSAVMRLEAASTIPAGCTT